MDRFSLLNLRNKITHAGGRAKVFQKNWWTQKYEIVSKRLKNTIKATLNKPPRPVTGLLSVNLQEQLRNAFTVANNAFVFQLPKRFIASEGINFENLLAACYADVKPTRHPFCVSSLELWSFILQHRNNRNHVAYKFRDYIEEEIRLLLLNWFHLDPIPHSLAKAFTNYGGVNSEEHQEFFNEIGYTRNNITKWLPVGFQKMCFSTISTYELFPNNSFNISYNVDAEVLTLNNQFQTNIVNQKIVVSYSSISTISNAYLRTGKLVTTFLQNRPFEQYEKDCVLNNAPNFLPWGGK